MQKGTTQIYGGIEAGGTKFICAVGNNPSHILAQTRVPTTTPEETFARCVQFFQETVKTTGPIAALGIASFGPVDPDPHSASYGHITSTPKAGWQNTDLAGHFSQALQVPIGFDTDVNGSALGEGKWGAAQGLSDFIYITVGTGIGGGIIANGEVVHGILHPEVGHLRPRRDAQKDAFLGICSFHGDCLEGLASGPAIAARWGMPAAKLPPDHPAWELESDYLAQAMTSLVLFCAPSRIIIGGGVMQQRFLFPMIQKKMRGYLNGYIQHAAILADVDTYLVPPGLGDAAGIAGAFVLAAKAVA